MKIIDSRPEHNTENKFYGVDVNDKEAVQKEFNKLKMQHRVMIFISFVVIVVLLLIFADFARVNYLGGRPLFATMEKVDKGRLYKGLGYKVLYCDNGKRYVGSVLYQTCEPMTEVDQDNFLYEKLLNYVTSENIVNKDELSELKINSSLYDGVNEKGGPDYVINLSYTCNNKDNCIVFKKEFDRQDNIVIYLRFDKFNEVYSIDYFKNSGPYYDKLVQNYKEKIKDYLIKDSKFQEDNIREFEIHLRENHGRRKFRGQVYSDSYLVEVDFMCKDKGNTCIVPFDKKDYEGDYANLHFFMSMFLDNEDNILLLGPREYLDL